MEVLIKDLIIEDREREDHGKIEKLTDSISRLGLLHPIVVKESGGEYELIAGERRVEACKELGWDQIPATLIEDVDSIVHREIELEENLKRKDFTWQEEIDAKRKLHELKQEKYGKAKRGADEGKWTLEKTAKTLDESAGTTSQDITLSRAIETFPELAEENTKTGAMKKYRKLMRKALEKKRKQDLKEQGNAPMIFNEDFFKWSDGKEDVADLIIADPPWGIDIDETRALGTEARDTRYNGEKDSFEDSYHYSLNLVERLIPQCHKLLKDETHMVMFIGTELLDDARQVAEEYFTWVDPMLMIWDKKAQGKPRMYGPAPCHEIMLHCMKGKRRPVKVHETIFRAKRVSSTEKDHPTQKPIALMKQIIETFTEIGETVLDPMFGLGASLLAALQNDRKALGCEKDEEYFLLANGKIIDYLGESDEQEEG